jgi:hypothetical protein
MIFPVICPECRSDSGRRIVPQSPEVQTFRCGACQYVWSEPGHASEIPVAAFEGPWRALWRWLRGIRDS